MLLFLEVLFSDMKRRGAALLEVLAPPDGDWLRVRTRDGLEGCVKRKNVYYRERAGGGGRGGTVAHSPHAHVHPMAVDGQVEPEANPATPVVPPRLDRPYEQYGDACVAVTWALTEQLLRPRDSEPAERASPFMWHWQASGRGEIPSWEPYPAHDALRLEFGLQRQNAEVAIDHGYVVNLTSMHQTKFKAADAYQYNTKTPDRRRRVRRALWYEYQKQQGTWEPVEPEQSMELESQEKQKVPELQRPQRWKTGFARGWVEVCECRQDAAALLQLVASGCEIGVVALALGALDRMPWDAAAWRATFAAHVAKKNYAGSKALRVLVMRTTLTALRQRYYTGSSGEQTQLDLADMLRPAVETLRHTPQTTPPIPPSCSAVPGMRVSVESIDCVEAGLRMQDQKLNPAVLNMANAFHPGGGYLSGAGAQEENLCRRSAYCLALEAPEPLYGLVRQRKGDHYPLGDEDGLYTPNVLVLRASEDAGYEWLPHPRYLSFVAVAAIDRPRVTRDRPPRLAPPERTLTAAKIRMILRIALYHRHDALVLSALGCGAFGNPPADVAAVFHEVFSEPEFHGAFREIVFAILDDQNTGQAHNPDGNFSPFFRQFSSSREY